MTSPQPSHSVLIVDDEPQIRRFLRISLSSQGYDVLEADTAARGLHLLMTEKPDAVVLDLGLPDVDGKTALTEIRAFSEVPIIILTVRSSESEIIDALDRGANDYMTKPFGIGEFMARLRSLLRPALLRDLRSHEFDDGSLRVDLTTREATRLGEPLHLTPKEYHVLQILIRNAGHVVTQKRLLREVWGPTHDRDTHYLRVVVGKIRQKLKDDPEKPAYVGTEPGVGYRFLGTNRKDR